MDLATLSTLIGMIIVGVMALVGSIFGGFIVAILLATITILGLAVLPTTPIIPIWVAVVVIVGEILYIAYRIGAAFGLGKGVGNS